MDQNMSMLAGPVVLLTGCTLLAGGLLYFLGVQFLRTTLQAVAALVGGGLLIVSMVIAFMADSGGYFLQAQKIYVSQCYIEGESTFPAERATKNNEAGRFISECASKLGYEWTPEHRKCVDFLVPMNAFCYLPTNPVSRAVTKLQLLFE